MSLVDLKTDLKSLKYGDDRPGGGDSKQPYYTVDINDIDKGINKFRLTKFDDGLIRGGVVGAANASVIDTMRIGKFLFTDIKGPLFIFKQVGLQLSNPRLEVPKNNRNIIQGGLDNISSVSTNGLLQPTRIYNLGINTLAQVPVSAIGGHITRHGILPVQNEASKYEAIVTANNENHNRLSTLTKKFELGDRKFNNQTNPSLLTRVNNLLGLANSISTIFGGPNIPSINQTPESLIIDQYAGGPDSVYGIGKTTIKRYSDTEDGIRIKDAFDKSSQFSGKTRNDKNEPIEIDYSKALGTGKNAISDYGSGDISIENNDIQVGINSNSVAYKNPNLKVYNDLRTQIEKQQELIVSSSNNFNIYDTANKAYSSKDVSDISYKNSYGDIIVMKSFKKWSDISREARVGSGRQDSINLTPIFGGNMVGDILDSKGQPLFDTNGNRLKDEYGDKYWMRDEVTIDGKKHNIRDFVKFRISSVLTDSFTSENPGGRVNTMVFRSYLTQFSDNVTNTVNSIKYAGRGNKFYVPDGFDRTINIGFKIAALSSEEMQPMYSKLNYLMATLMPDYKDNLMRGSLVRMTVGNYLDAQLGILTSLSYNIPQDAPWEIALDEPEGGTRQLILPHVLEVTLTFIPIGAETQGENKIEDKNRGITFIAQNNTGIDKDKIQYYDYFNNKFNV